MLLATEMGSCAVGCDQITYNSVARQFHAVSPSQTNIKSYIPLKQAQTRHSLLPTSGHLQHPQHRPRLSALLLGIRLPHYCLKLLDGACGPVSLATERLRRFSCGQRGCKTDSQN